MQDLINLGVCLITNKQTRQYVNQLDKQVTVYSVVAVNYESNKAVTLSNLDVDTFNKLKDGKKYNISSFTETVNYTKDGEDKSFDRQTFIITKVKKS